MCLRGTSVYRTLGIRRQALRTQIIISKSPTWVDLLGKRIFKYKSQISQFVQNMIWFGLNTVSFLSIKIFIFLLRPRRDRYQFTSEVETPRNDLYLDGTTEDHQVIVNGPLNDESGDVFATDRYLKDNTDDAFAVDRYLKDDTDDGFATDKHSSGDNMAKRSYLPARLQAAR